MLESVVWSDKMSFYHKKILQNNREIFNHRQFGGNNQHSGGNNFRSSWVDIAKQ